MVSIGVAEVLAERSSDDGIGGPGASACRSRSRGGSRILQFALRRCARVVVERCMRADVEGLPAGQEWERLDLRDALLLVVHLALDYYYYRWRCCCRPAQTKQLLQVLANLAKGDFARLTS